ncbi:helix-turn-helix transcriptional regulator [Candidatus Thioglobus autotrophicus]|uniref:helix-turn-helix transcriptional regulator n=1 Tax=Candidatus Thioglobus autotrophicus TaxID=1705394 RepID=UPI00299DB03C|nr:helix-turn-helix transcriptional regulator [Candidatus Thioglobus autotrophicus]WPE16078.1 helix-turn-helix transcriptional regulator [Candidatus Thioglobus autotrophicus]
MQVSFSNVLKQERLATGLSQEKFAEKVGLSMHSISLLETGKQQPTLPTLNRIAKALDIKTSELLKLIEK